MALLRDTQADLIGIAMMKAREVVTERPEMELVGDWVAQRRNKKFGKCLQARSLWGK